MEHTYYGAVICGVLFGPRRELTLDIETWPHRAGEFRVGAGVHVMVRFGGIQNMEEVRACFDECSMDRCTICEMEQTLNLRGGWSKIESDRNERRVRIVALHVEEKVSCV